MKIGIIANITKESVFDVVGAFIEKLKKNKIDYLLTNSLVEEKGKLKIEIDEDFVTDDSQIYKQSDIIISIGGDGTLLTTAYNAQFYDKPVLGVNIGKLGFIVEADVSHMDKIIEDLKDGKYEIQERIILTGECDTYPKETLYAINDLVIDKDGWPKMIELTIWVDDEYVTSFLADGVIAATPIGSTGYSLSTGGPIVSPSTDAITLCPISPHSLTMRPLVLSSNQKITIKADSPHSQVQISCDGQRVYNFPPPFEIKIQKADRPIKLIHTSFSTYFETLRNKLLWGIDVRNKMKNEGI